MDTATHATVQERAAAGKQRRTRAPVTAHSGWRPASDRPDPIALIEEQDRTRDPDLVPVRHGRMLASPFTFYRGTAGIMAADLRDTPRAGLTAQLCGDAHLSNFGVFASPERDLLFGINDFDETLPGPFEYDVLRLAASFTVAARNNALSAADVQTVTLAAVRSYREAMREFAEMGTLEIWYASLDEQDIMSVLEAAVSTSRGKAQKKAAKQAQRTAEKAALKARSRNSLQALSKLAERVDGEYRIISSPPVVVPSREFSTAFGISPDQLQETVQQEFRSYRQTLQEDRRLLLERYELIDIARKVVGVGSVGTRAFIALLQGRDEGDPLFLQLKEARRSVLEDHLPRSVYRQPGKRVVQGQRLMQAASDIFLGWTPGMQQNRYLYWRQLRDMKGSAAVENMTPLGMELYARVCGWTLARAHARSGDPVAIGAYLGKSEKFDSSVCDFSARYADQNEQDYEVFAQAVRSGRLEAVEGV
ncbi:DUF2252 domain-containing protein [Arthrobacter gandavensis]|uniref:DUF2252 domain-containing protein n=1 Tax=Arthrobacter gandavensis TaxID=169960 RepID=UPI00188DDFAB|nr:DUF2252 domain-containing protein [Arthrobacter gandavensis]MBF4995458.1 DUF2252 domain-containing protein [Arthrobacter gandavensis]